MRDHTEPRIKNVQPNDATQFIYPLKQANKSVHFYQKDKMPASNGFILN